MDFLRQAVENIKFKMLQNQFVFFHFFIVADIQDLNNKK